MTEKSQLNSQHRQEILFFSEGSSPTLGPTQLLFESYRVG